MAQISKKDFLLIASLLVHTPVTIVVNNGIINGGITQSLAQTTLDLIPEDTPIRAPTVISKKKPSSKKPSCTAVRHG